MEDMTLILPLYAAYWTGLTSSSRCSPHETDSSSECSSLHFSRCHCYPINLAMEDKTIVSLLLFFLTSGNQWPFGISNNNLPAIIDLTMSKFTKLLTICQATVLRADRVTSMKLMKIALTHIDFMQHLPLGDYFLSPLL